MTKIVYRPLGKSGLSVSAVGLGCMSLSGVYGAAEDEQSVALIRHAIDAGINHLDSSDMYGWGHNEQVVGRALKGLQATTHWNAIESLKAFGAEPVSKRFVREGKIITAAGVSAGIDMALQLVELEHGKELAQTIQLLIEYDPHPPVDTGSPGKATPAIIEKARQILRVLYSPRGLSGPPPSPARPANDRS